MKRTSLTEKMVLYFLALGIGSIIITGFFSFFTARRALLDRTYDQLTSIRMARQSQLENYFSDRLHETSFFAGSDEIKNLATHYRDDKTIGSPGNDITVAGTLLSSDYYSGFMLLDPSGNLLCKSKAGLPPPLLHAGLLQHLSDSLKTGVFMLEQRSDSVKTGYDLYSVSRINVSGEPAAWLLLKLKREQINNYLLEDSPEKGFGYSGETYLVGPDYLMRSKSRFISNSVMQTSVETFAAKQALQNKEGISQISDYRGTEVLSSYGKINVSGLHWVILSEIDYQEATASVNSIRNNILLLSVFTGLAFFIITYVISRKMTNPIKRLKDAAIQLGEGRLNTPVGIVSEDEIGELTTAFNRMAINLKDKDEALKMERANRLKSAIDGQDQERQRLSRELHDGIGQSMIAIRLRLGAMENSIPEKLSSNLESVIALTDDLIDEVKAISNALMPPALAEFGLTSAIRSLCNNLTETTGIQTEFNGEIHGHLFGRKARLYIFRIFQEVMNNAAKHSGAGELKIESVLNDNILYLSLTDNGVGFDMQSDCVSRGHGLNNIKERVSLLKGEAVIYSRPGEGTRISIEIPLSKQKS